MEKLYIEEMESRVAPVAGKYGVEIDGVMVMSGLFEGTLAQLWQYIYAWALGNGIDIGQMANRFTLEID